MGKEHDTPMDRDAKPEKLLLKLENCTLTEKLPELVLNMETRIP